MIYMFTLHVILSHALGVTSSITERSSVILSHALQRLRRLLSVSFPVILSVSFPVILSVSEESVTDPSLHFVPFRMTVGRFRMTVSLYPA